MSADVDGASVVYESDSALVASPEAFATAFLLPAMVAGMDLEIDAPLCSRWLENVETVRAFVRAHWPDWSGGHVHHAGAVSPWAEAATGSALFFGGGVDSFFCLHETRASLDSLVYVQGFDVPLSDYDRGAAVLHVDRQVAHACQLRLLSVGSNLRSHPLYKRATWLMLYGGALASVGHVLQAHCASFLLSGWGIPTFPLVRGSHPEMEPGWSSSVVEFRHHGETYTRTDKVQRVAGWRLCQQHLRVCWEHRSDDLNCGECEKCVRTQLELLAAGGLGAFETFPPASLVDRIDGEPGITAPHMGIYRGLLERLDEHEAEVREAVTRLLERSPLAPPARVRGLRRVGRRLVRLLQRDEA